MKASILQLGSLDAGKLPLDLREWIDSLTLFDCVNQAADRLNLHAELSSNALFSRWYGGLPSVDCLSRLLAFAYCCAVFSSEEVVRTCRTDPIFRELCEHELPFREELISFRRSHRALLAELITTVLHHALSETFETENTADSGNLPHRMYQSAIERLDIARHLDSTDE